MTKMLDNKQAADFISGEYFEISHRTLDSWPDLPGRVLNRKKWHTKAELEAAVRRRIAAAEQRRAALLRTHPDALNPVDTIVTA
jgi:hypothetical protein